MPETTAYTAAEAYATLQTMPRIWKAQAKVIEILEENLNDYIAYANVALEANGEAPMNTVDNTVLPAPAKIGDSFINKCIVGMAVNYEHRGSGLIDVAGVLSIFIIDQRLEDASDVAPLWDRGAMVVAALEKFAPGCYDAAGNQLWRALKPLGMTILPEAWADYSGVAINYEILQHTTAKQSGGDVSHYWPDVPED